MNISEKTKAQLLTMVQELEDKVSQLEKNQEMSQIIAQHTSDSIAITSFDLKATYLYVSPAVTHLLGWEPEELLGKSFFDFIHKNDKLALMPLARKYMKLILSKALRFDDSGISETIEYRFIDKAGTYHNMQSTINFIGKNLLAISRDISENKKAEQALRESEERFKQLSNVTFEGILIHEKGVAVDMNYAFSDMFGYRRKDLLGKDIIKMLVPQKHHKLTGDNIKKQHSLPYEIEGVKKDGSIIPIEVEARNVRIDKREVRVTAVRDISERKKIEYTLRESEARFKRLATNTLDTIWTTDLNFKLTYVNEAIYLFLGYQPEEVIGKNPSEFTPEDELPKLKAFAEEILSKAKPNELSNFKLELKHYHKNGQLIDVEITGNPIFDEEDKIVGLQGRSVDISERIRQAAQIREQAVFVNKNPAPVLSTDYSGCVLIANEAATELLTNLAVGQPIWSSFPSLSESEFEKFPTTKPIQIEEAIGTDHYLFTVNRDSTTRAVYFFGANITKRKRAEEVRFHNEQRIALHVDQSPLGVIEWDLDFKVKRWNPAAERIFGYSASEALNQNAGFIVPKKYLKHVDQVWEQLLKQKGGSRSTNENIRKDGKTIICDWYNTPLINDEGKVIAVSSLIKDISENVRAEHIQKILFNISNAALSAEEINDFIGLIQKELGSILDTTNFYVALYDKKTDSLSLPFFSDERDKISDMPKGKTLTRYVLETKESLLATMALKNELVSQGKLTQTGTISKIWLGVPLQIDGEIMGVLAVQSYQDEDAYDTSDLKLLEFVSDQISIAIARKKSDRDLKIALDTAKESDRLKSAFLANMSHEIRTPMNGILGFASLLHQTDLNDDQREKYVNIIEKSGARMLNIINDLIDISKIEAGQMELSLSECNINAQIEYLHVFFNPEAAKKGIKLSYEASLDKEEAVIRTDKEKLYAILTNLIKNAIKYTHEGSIHVGYTVEDKMLKFFVKDTGIGIPIDRQEAVFERFIQADIEDTNAYEGAGLGLAITKAYLDLLGGEIWLESTEGNGSIFYFTLPLHKLPKSAAGFNKREHISDNINHQDLSLNILIVEDEEFADTFLSLVLKKMSRKIYHAKTGKEAVEICRSQPQIDLILMDIKLPVMNGYAATRIIRSFNKEVVIFAQTAYGMEGDREKALKAGCNDYLSKPINKKLLKEMIASVFQSSKKGIKEL